ncbi:MAG: hypothetical protein CVU98_04165 [Firmicutes bacterium HGW-Firmicutes-3]|nr:MAG: hypothetical protein CVU98_04165 [Firmicutes bacterium HGW-Firmicutes-3]
MSQFYLKNFQGNINKAVCLHFWLDPLEGKAINEDLLLFLLDFYCNFDPYLVHLLEQRDCVFFFLFINKL